MSELLPCPFCGCDELHAFEYCDGEDSFGFQCTRCWMTGSHHETRDAALAAWNTRSPIHVLPTCPENGEKLTGQGWRPIETAPRDGTLILACQRPDDGVCWFKTWEQWKGPQTVAWRGYHVNAPGKETWRDGKGSPVIPDLWMPLDVLSVQP